MTPHGRVELLASLGGNAGLSHPASTPAGSGPGGWRPGYPGGKGQDGVYQRIIGQMPPHSLYVEPFAGSAAVFFHKQPAQRSILIDASASVTKLLAASAPAHGDVEVIQGDALRILALKPAWPADTVVYCDPPYLLETRQGRRYYEHEFEDEHHWALLCAIRKLPCRVLVSGYPSDLYRIELCDWRCMTGVTRAARSVSGFRCGDWQRDGWRGCSGCLPESAATSFRRWPRQTSSPAMRYPASKLAMRYLALGPGNKTARALPDPTLGPGRKKTRRAEAGRVDP